MQKVSELRYERVALEEVIEHIRACTRKATDARNGRELAEARTECLGMLFHFQTMSALSFTRFSLNTRDRFYADEKDYYDEAVPQTEGEYAKFQRAFLQNPHMKESEAYLNPLVLQHYALAVKCNSDQAVPYKVEENKIVTEYTKLMAETLFPFEGEELPLSALRKYFTHADRAVRQKAYETLGRTLAGIGDTLDDLFDRLVKVRTKTARVLGYDNFVALGDNLLGRISFDRNMLHAFRDNVKKDIVPAVARLKENVRRALSLDGPFMLYDNDSYFANGNPAPVLNAQQMFEAGKTMYADMGKETGAFFDFMLQTDAFDVFPREGKWGGGYCTSFADYRQPFILANFNGTSGDVDVLTHEAGHAFADYMTYRQNHDLELNVGGMETAETHSMSMEFLCYKYMDAFFGNRADDYRYAHLCDALTFLPYGTIVDYFQEEVYSNPDMTPAQRNALWNKLESEFRPWLTAEGIPYLEKGTRWQYQMHIFETPLYYIDYCLAQSVALQFLARSQADYAGAFEAYVRLLKQGGNKTFPALVTDAGLVSPFEKGALAGIAADAEKLLQAYKK